MYVRNSFNSNTVVGNIIILNILAMLTFYVLGYSTVEACGQEGSFRTAYYYGALYLPGSDWFRPWQLLTHIFLHDKLGSGGWMHIVFNMYGIWMFGSLLENRWGAKRFLIFYIICGIGASLCYLAVRYYQLSGLSPSDVCIAQHIPMVGASGALFALLLAYGLLFPNTELMIPFFPIPIKAKYFVLGYGLIELYSGFSNNPGDNVAHFAHLGGMLFGFILVKIYNRDRTNFY